MRKHVDVTSLNFRSEPVVADHTKLGSLHLGQPVEVLAEAGVVGWVEAEADLDGNRQRGFVSDRFLRDSVAEGCEILAAQAIREWLRFKRGLGLEHVDPFFRFVGEMWQAVGANLDGKDRDVPWSAAAISFIVRNADRAMPGSKYGRFKFAAAHARFINDAIRSARQHDAQAPFWGRRVDEAKPSIGDLVCRNRTDEKITFDFAAEHDDFKSHSDIIIRVAGDHVVTLGGNVSHSVRFTRYELMPNDFLDPDDGNVFALLVNRHA
jgi:hypothetical protein